jgi:BMFP domain-containing protein YqiC
LGRRATRRHGAADRRPKLPVERLGHTHRRLRRNVMLNSKTLDDLAAKIGKAFEGSPAKDIEKNVKAMLQSGLSRLDLVTRAEFDVQAEVLRKTRDKVERLEARVAELEARMPPPQAPA